MYANLNFSVLEDLSEKGYRMATGGITLDDAHLEATLKALSRMHASSILLELSKSISLDHEYPTLFKEILYNEKDINGVHAKWISWQILDLLMVVDFSEKYTHSEKAFIKENFAKQINRIYCMNKKTTK